ncbi:hypothetical protein H311_00985 [Anncaliia algerae PRA109]|nr:hypothetical protein H311_00985 [Anncaliia algerae PRA109]
MSFQLSDEQRAQIIVLLEQGLTVREVTSILGICHSTVVRINKKHKIVVLFVIAMAMFDFSV